MNGLGNFLSLRDGFACNNDADRTAKKYHIEIVDWWSKCRIGSTLELESRRTASEQHNGQGRLYQQTDTPINKETSNTVCKSVENMENNHIIIIFKFLFLFFKTTTNLCHTTCLTA